MQHSPKKIFERARLAQTSVCSAPEAQTIGSSEVCRNHNSSLCDPRSDRKFNTFMLSLKCSKCKLQTFIFCYEKVPSIPINQFPTLDWFTAWHPHELTAPCWLVMTFESNKTFIIFTFSSSPSLVNCKINKKPYFNFTRPFKWLIASLSQVMVRVIFKKKLCSKISLLINISFV